MKNLPKILVRIVLILAVAVAAVLVLTTLKGGDAIRKIVEVAGPKALGVPVKLAGVSFRPWKGHITLTGLQIGNPEGFKSPNLFDLGQVQVDVDLGSLLSDTIVIRRVLVEKPEVTYEIALGKTNVGKLLDQLEGGKEPEGESREPKPETSPAKPAKPGKKVVIDEFLVKDGQINIAATVLGGHGAPVRLQDIEMKDIGREGGGADPAKVVVIVMGTVIKSIIAAVGDIGKAALEGVKGAEQLGEDAAKAVGKGLSEAAKGLSEAAKGLGKAAQGDASGLVKDLGNLFKKPKKNDAEP